MLGPDNLGRQSVHPLTKCDMILAVKLNLIAIQAQPHVYQAFQKFMPNRAPKTDGLPAPGTPVVNNA